MIERIEEERKALRESGSIAKNSYIAMLSKPIRKPRTSIRIRNLSTLNILNYVDESFRLVDRVVLQRLDAVHAELATRNDLFDAVLTFIQNSKVRSDLYYWLPGFSVNNIFAFISQAVPDFVKLYKDYYARSIIADMPMLDCLPFIKERFKDHYPTFKIMEADIRIFECCLSAAYWTDCPLSTVSEACRLFVGATASFDLTEDVEATLAPELSYVECVISGRTHVVSLLQLDGLLTKNTQFKKFWMDLEVTDDGWNILE